MRTVERVTTHEAKTRLSQLLARVEAGEEIVICRGSLAVARLVPILPSQKDRPKRPRVGTVTSDSVQCREDAFAPLSDADLAQWDL